MMYLQGGIQLLVVSGVDFNLEVGECVVLGGFFGVGKSFIFKMVYGNYVVNVGLIFICYEDCMVDLVIVDLCEVLVVWCDMIGYVSQFLCILLCVVVIDVVVELLVVCGVDCDVVCNCVSELFVQFNLLEWFWVLLFVIFFGGEQQCVNIVCGFIMDYLVLLFDELIVLFDVKNRVVVVDFIKVKKV